MTGDQWGNKQKNALGLILTFCPITGEKMLLQTERQTRFFMKASTRSSLIKDIVGNNLPLSINVHWAYHKALFVVTLASSTNIPERTACCLQPQLGLHYVKPTTSSQAICRTPQIQHHLVDKTSLFTEIYSSTSPSCFSFLLQCAILCCGVVGAVYPGGHSFSLISSSWTSSWSVCDRLLCCLWALCGTQVKVKHLLHFLVFGIKPRTPCMWNWPILQIKHSMCVGKKTLDVNRTFICLHKKTLWGNKQKRLASSPPGHYICNTTFFLVLLFKSETTVYWWPVLKDLQHHSTTDRVWRCIADFVFTIGLLTRRKRMNNISRVLWMFRFQP